jgi:hypothetical protein
MIITLPWPPSVKGKWRVCDVEFLVANYPSKGRSWCAAALGKTDAQIRSKASRLGLKARGVSEAWHLKNQRHAEKLRGRKHPERAQLMKNLHASGALLKSEEQRREIGLRVKAWISENGHPRGATGMKHTDQTKRVIGEKSAAAHCRRTEEQRIEVVMKMMRSRHANGTMAPPRFGTTWKAGWREIGGVRKFYRSKWEANYAMYLQWLKENGHIAGWSHEPKTFWFAGVKRGTVSYLPDFWVQELDGREAFHEVKGWMDDRSKTKISRMAKYYPAVVLVVIDAKAYAELKRKVSSLVPGWEP